MNARLLLIDNYDSFTYNLVQAFEVLGAEVSVHRNDAVSVPEALASRPTHLCISPGPGTPGESGISRALIRACSGRIPVLGVCLGHQAIVDVFGGEVVRAARPMHGKTSALEHCGTGLFTEPAPVLRRRALPLAGRRAEALPDVLAVTATRRDGRDHGRAAPPPPDRRRAVPPGKHPDARRAAPARQLPERELPCRRCVNSSNACWTGATSPNRRPRTC